MKKLNFLKYAAFATLALSLSFGFTSCSDDDDDGNGNGNGGGSTPKTIKLPTIIEGYETDGPDNRTDNKYELTYNDKNQIISIKATDKENNGEANIELYGLSYNDKGQIIKMTRAYENSDPEIYTYIYDDAKGIVTVTYGGGYEDVYKIDKNGYRASGKTVDGENSDEYIFTYDSNYNLTRAQNIYIYEGTEYRYDSKYTYGSVYSPYINVEIPAWFLQEDEAALPFEGLVGKYLPNKGEFSEKIIREGQEDKEYNSVTTITNTKDADNYPTEIKVVITYNDDVYKDNRSYKITYKTVEKK